MKTNLATPDPTVRASSKAKKSNRPPWKSDFLLLPLALFTVFCIFTALRQIGSSFQYADPLSLYLQLHLPITIACFGILYCYRAFHGYYQSLLTKISAAIVSIIFGAVLIVTLNLLVGAPTCMRLEALNECAGLYDLALNLLLFNPFVGIVLALTAVVGIISTLIKKQNLKSKDPTLIRN